MERSVMLPSGTAIRSRREMSGVFPSFDPDTSQCTNIAPSDPLRSWVGTDSRRVHALPKNVKQNLQRATERRELYKQECSSLRKENTELLRDQYRLEIENAEKDQIISDRTAELIKLKSELTTTRKLFAEQEAQMDEMRSQLQVQSSKIKGLKSSGQYSSATTLAVVKLKSLGVADEKVGQALDIVAGELFNTKLEATPSATTVARMSYTTNALANKHTKRLLSKLVKGKKFMALGSDETTKLFHKLQAYQLWYIDENGKRTVHNLGMKEVVTKSAEVSLNTVKSILDRIEKSDPSVQGSETRNSFRDIVIGQINSAMGDRASTQTRFAELFEKYRTEILPNVIDEWATMSDDEHAAHEIFQSLPCQLHVIASSISPAMSALARHEEILTGVKNLKEDTCSVNKAIQLFTHHFGSRASGKYGTYRIFRAWCNIKKIKCNSLPALMGNRFVIIPTIAARIFLNRTIYTQFLEEMDIECKKSLLDALSNNIVMKHMQTLGFIDQFVTGPLWRILNGDINTLDSHM
ncbi:hypothetical protein PRIPAC_90660 [Pristionchus pacificus]|uniref:Uncharacterized protein n=1 Tax=Pristionchus pacificus TaxID=54126 RepID=A0A2A6CYA6_PRIPA|nr:hypothetical protein PRIPAC_90660 [Pristionchus pacificus]|eukprot:PDM83155.1 hypothetical protein PRIPAC_37548 [Pristionchus pacificus]